MKLFDYQVLYLLRNQINRENFKKFFKLIFWLAATVVVYSTVFHVIMEWEGREYSWLTGFYWTLTVMSTLGFGDITFNSDLGRMFSMLVLLSGTISLLVVLPFTFINFFYQPWIEARGAARAPRELPVTANGHVILTEFDPITQALIDKLTQYHYPYTLIVPDLAEALRLHDLSVNVLAGNLDDPETFRKARVETAALVFASGNDITNTNVAFIVRELSSTIPVFTRARAWATVEILKSLGGTNHVLRPSRLMGDALARSFIGGDAKAHIIGQFDKLLIGEGSVAGTPMVGKTLPELKLAETTGVYVVGIWQRGNFGLAKRDTELTEHCILLIAGLEENLARYNDLYGRYHHEVAPVVIVGGGRSGRATGYALAKRKVDYRIIEQKPELVRKTGKYVQGNAAELEVLQKAKFMESPAVFITSSDDEVNIYLTIYYRKLRPDIEIISRATHERNIQSLHRAGADFVLSYATMGATEVFNSLKRCNILMITEGLEAFLVPVPEILVGKTIAESEIRTSTGCSAIAVVENGIPEVNPDPLRPLSQHASLVLIGQKEAERRFLKLYDYHLEA